MKLLLFLFLIFVSINLSKCNTIFHIDYEYCKNNSYFEPNYIHYLVKTQTEDKNILYIQNTLVIKDQVKEKDIIKELYSFYPYSYDIPVQLVGNYRNFMNIIMGPLSFRLDIGGYHRFVTPNEGISRLNLPSIDYESKSYVSMVFQEKEENIQTSNIGFMRCLELDDGTGVECNTIESNIFVDISQFYSFKTTHERKRNLYCIYVLESKTNDEYFIIYDVNMKNITSIKKMESGLEFESIGIVLYDDNLYIGGISKSNLKTEIYKINLETMNKIQIYSTSSHVSSFVRTDNNRLMMFYSNDNLQLTKIDLSNYQVSYFKVPQLKNVSFKNQMYASVGYPIDEPFFTGDPYDDDGIITDVQIAFIVIGPFLFIVLLSYIVYYFTFGKRKQVKLSENELKKEEKGIEQLDGVDICNKV